MTERTNTLSYDEFNDILKRIALAELDNEDDLANQLWLTFFPTALPQRNERFYLKLTNIIYLKKNRIRSKRQKRKRIKKKLQLWEKQGDLYFITLTFNQDHLNKGTPEERIKCLRQDLNATCENYIANKDYGKKRGREHYHALALNLNGEELKKRRKEIGYVDYEKVSRKLGVVIDYCMKLTNHALKDSTDGKIIYCRKTKKKEQEAINLLEDELKF